MKRFLYTAIISSTLLLTAANAEETSAANTIATAQEFTTAYKIHVKEQQGYMADEVKTANDKCGSHIEVSADVASFSKSDYTSNSISGYCAAPAQAIQMLCDNNDAYKDAVKQKITRINCSYGLERAISLDGTTLNYMVDFKSSNDSDFAKDFLNSKL